jgi:phosphoribosylformylglycinamidine synthase
VHHVEVRPSDQFVGSADERLRQRIQQTLDLELTGIRHSRVYYLRAAAPTTWDPQAVASLLSDPVAERVFVDHPPHGDCDWILEIGYKAGVTDNAGHTAAETLAGVAGSGDAVTVRMANRYYVTGPVSEADVQRIGTDLLGNPLVHQITVVPGAEATMMPSPRLDVETATGPAWTEVPLPDDDDALLALSRKGLLALNLDEMRAIRNYYAEPQRQAARQVIGLPAWPTDVELEALAQTWSEHCKHKIFNARIRYTEGDQTSEIDGLFATYIKGSTRRIANTCDWLVSVFEDNAGVVRWTDDHHAVFKVETHNAPSALEPYGGALTGIVGVNRDPAGTGIGAKLAFNTDVFCFAPLNWSQPLPPGVLHPQRLFTGVRQGVEDGGNQSGIPTVNGALFFDERYLGRPLVFCGTGAIMPATTAGQPSHLKTVHAGDLIVMTGGRVGKDGIHGATFSSQATGAAAPVGVVQIGDPITQKRMLDMLTEARERGLYRAITDNGAGGLSSSVGEMAEFSGGAKLELDQVPLKYPGLAPWEILVSESQERMTLAVPPEYWPALANLARQRGVEATVIGTFTADGTLSATWQGEPVMELEMAFLHQGLPQRLLEAVWQVPRRESALPELPQDLNAVLLSLLGSWNICSRESVIRQYDHEVQGGSVVKPLVGVANDGPSDAAVIRPLLDQDTGLTISCAINPHYGDIDTEAMARLAVDEAMRNLVAVGADPYQVSMLDNFCWPDPVYDPEHNPDGPFKLAQLVRACRGLYDATIAYGAPLISGKDSMKNDYHGPDGKLSIPPTLLVSAMATHPDIRKAVTMDAKAAGDLVYILGTTRAELGGSQYGRHLGWTGGDVPTVQPDTFRRGYDMLHQAIMAELVESCHDCSEGGLAVAAAETAFSGGLGLHIDLDAVPTAAHMRVDELLFSESAGRHLVTIMPAARGEFERYLHDLDWACIGTVTADPRVVITTAGNTVIDLEIGRLKQAWQGGLAQ